MQPEAVSALVQSTRQLAREMAAGDVVRMLFDENVQAAAAGAGVGTAGEPLLVDAPRGGMEALLQPCGPVVGVLFHQLADTTATGVADAMAAAILSQATRHFADRYAAQLEKLVSPSAGGQRSRGEAEEARRVFANNSRDFDAVLLQVIAEVAGRGNVMSLPVPEGSFTTSAVDSSPAASGLLASSADTVGSMAPTAGGHAGILPPPVPPRAHSGLSLRSVGAVQVASPVGTITPTERPTLLTPQPSHRAGGPPAAGAPASAVTSTVNQ